jgi:predicted nucleotidyltransferase
VLDARIVSIAREYLRDIDRRGIPVRFGVLYGSWATGRVHEWSDIDLVVVSPHFDGGIRRPDINLLWKTAALVDSRIEPVACGERQWLEDDASAIIEIARREGERISLEDAVGPRI